MRYAEPDIYLTSTTVGGLPTCILRPKPYTRYIRTVLVSNTVTSGVFGYRGTLGSQPVLQSLLGNNNTLRGDIRISAGQLFYVQWTAAGSATVRFSLEREDDPFSAGAIGGGSEWDSQAITSLIAPVPGTAFIKIGADIPAELQTKYSGTVVAAVIYQQSPTNYSYDAVVSTANVFRVTGVVITGIVKHISTMLAAGANFLVDYGAVPLGGVADAGSILVSSDRPFVAGGGRVCNTRAFIGPVYAGVIQIGPGVGGAWTNVTGTVSISPSYADTGMEVDLYGSAYADVGGGVLEIEYGIHLTSGPYDQTFSIASFPYNTGFEHNTTSGVMYIPTASLRGVLASYNAAIAARLRQGDGVNSCRIDGNDRFSARLAESFHG